MLGKKSRDRDGLGPSLDPPRDTTAAGTGRDVDLKHVTEQPGPGLSPRLGRQRGRQHGLGASGGPVLLARAGAARPSPRPWARPRPALWRASSVRRGSAPCGSLGGGMSAQTRASRSSGSSTRATVPSRQGFLSEYRSLDVTVLFADSQAAGNSGSRSLRPSARARGSARRWLARPRRHRPRPAARRQCGARRRG